MSISIRIAVFFDGTANNAYNSAKGSKSSKPGSGDMSYFGDYTNIWRMHTHFQGYEKNMGIKYWTNLYIAGTGTNSFDKDSIAGIALGVGKAGVESRANEAIIRSLAFIKNVTASGDHVSVKFDVFGFSRGAATARHFIHRVIPEGDNCLAELLKRNKKKIKADVSVICAGLFETVSSVGAKFSNDTRKLNLDSVQYVKKMVFHICGADEYRKDFSLTNIDSAIKAGVGTEVILPGAHSDIGGGYPASIGEDIVTISGSRTSIPGPRTPTTDADIAWLVKEGFFKRNKIITRKRKLGSTRPSGRRPAYIHYNKASRIVVYNDYTYIPLFVMVRKAESCGIKFDCVTMKRVYSILKPILPKVNKNIRAYVKRVEADPEKKWDILTNGGSGNLALPNDFKFKFVHYSSDELGIGLRTRWLNKKDAIRKRMIFKG